MATEEAVRSNNIIAKTLDITDGWANLSEYLIKPKYLSSLRFLTSYYRDATSYLKC